MIGNFSVVPVENGYLIVVANKDNQQVKNFIARNMNEVKAHLTVAFPEAEAMPETAQISKNNQQDQQVKNFIKK